MSNKAGDFIMTNQIEKIQNPNDETNSAIFDVLCILSETDTVINDVLSILSENN